jgi:GNAT superfamily N-acetyltransferase
MSITIRSIEPGDADLDALVDVVIQAFPHDPQWPYRYAYREEYPEDHYKYTRIYYAEYLDMTFAGQNTIMLAEAPSIEDPSVKKVIAMSIWDNYGDAPPNPDLPAIKPPANHPERRDASPARLEKYTECSMKARKELFVSRYGERQLSLRQMATLPAYWRKGAATMLCKWGMEKARKVSVAVPMFASPMGKRLYESLGFKELGTFRVQVDGEDEVLVVHALTWEPAWEQKSEEGSVEKVG